MPIAVGSVTDVIMRAAAPELSSGLSPIIVENKGGASGIPGAQSCAQATPDGYTLCLVYHSTMSINLRSCGTRLGPLARALQDQSIAERNTAATVGRVSVGSAKEIG